PRDVMSQSIAIAVRGDRLVERDEDFFVRLSNPSKGAMIADGVGMVTIADNEPRVGISSPALLEGDSGAAPLTFTVGLSTAYDLPVTVNYTVTGGTATAGSDYSAAPAGTLTFQPGQRLQTVTAEVIGDRLIEPDETILVKLSTSDSYAALSAG